VVCVRGAARMGRSGSGLGRGAGRMVAGGDQGQGRLQAPRRVGADGCERPGGRTALLRGAPGTT